MARAAVFMQSCGLRKVEQRLTVILVQSEVAGGHLSGLLPALLPGEQGEREQRPPETIKAMMPIVGFMAFDVLLCVWTILGLNQ